jgi:hypothetical protein
MWMIRLSSHSLLIRRIFKTSKTPPKLFIKSTFKIHHWVEDKYLVLRRISRLQVSLQVKIETRATYLIPQILHLLISQEKYPRTKRPNLSLNSKRNNNSNSSHLITWLHLVQLLKFRTSLLCWKSLGLLSNNYAFTSAKRVSWSLTNCQGNNIIPDGYSLRSEDATLRCPNMKRQWNIMRRCNCWSHID